MIASDIQQANDQEADDDNDSESDEDAITVEVDQMVIMVLIYVYMCVYICTNHFFLYECEKRQYNYSLFCSLMWSLDRKS